MADSESDLETDGLELALDTLYNRHCSNPSSLNSKDYCSEFCELVEEYTGQWQVPLPQLKVLRTALCSFTKSTVAFPDDCQHIHHVLSSLALSHFELMLFFSKEEFVEEPLKYILDSFQECHSHLLRHRNTYFQQVKQTIKAGGPWENPVLQRILKEKDLPPQELEEFLSSESPVFLEFRVRYLQACERIQEAMALAKSCLENSEAGKHLFFHQAYLTCLYKASLHEHLHKEMAEIDGRDAVEIICNTERVEKDELLLSLSKAFLTQYLHNGDMYYIWDLLFIWSRLHLRAHPSRQGFLTECLELASSATNVRAIFPFIKLVTTEVGSEGTQVCVELCARALQLCDMQADSETRSLVCKTIAFLLPHDLEICRACALLAFCQERSLEAYRAVSLLYMHPDQEPHPHNSPVRTNVRFQILQMLKERLCFDPEFWNLLTLRTYCLELMSDNVMKAAVLNEMKEEEEKEYIQELSTDNLNDSSTQDLSLVECTEATVAQDLPEEQILDVKEELVSPPTENVPRKRKKWRRRLRRQKQPASDDEADPADDPEFKYNLQTEALSNNNSMYSLRRNHTNKENSAVPKFPLNRKREYLSRCVKSQILKRKGCKKRWLQGLPRLEQVQNVLEKLVKVKGKKRGRKPLVRLEFSFPDNEIFLTKDEFGFVEHTERDTPHQEIKIKQDSNAFEIRLGEQAQEESEKQLVSRLSDGPSIKDEPSTPAVETGLELDGPLLEFLNCPVVEMHSYSLASRQLGIEESSAPDGLNGDAEGEETSLSNDEVKTKRTWRDRMLRTQQYSHMSHHCAVCRKDYKGLNIMRHALSHLKKKKLRCILCGKRFKMIHFAKKHVVEHFDEMCKQKPSDKEPPTTEPATANGDVNIVENPKQPQEESRTKVSSEEIPERKTTSKIKVSSLSREDRIVRNLRTLIKKTSVLHKKCRNPEANIFKPVEFSDEQVVIKDGQVIIREPFVIAVDALQEGEQSPAVENGLGMDIKYHLCPSLSCDRVFLRISSTLLKHALKSHIPEENVLEKTFVWSKHKCNLCLRSLQHFEHYKEHLKLHDDPLQHFCYHQECKQRYATPQELKEHISTHKPFRPQCPFTACEQLFPTLMGLYEHEWRHYIPTPQKEDLESGVGRQQKQSAEAPWKQRVKVEELWLQNNNKIQRESPAPINTETSNNGNLGEMSQTGQQHSETNSLNSSENLPEESSEPLNDNKVAVNGFEDSAKPCNISKADPSSPLKRIRKKEPAPLDPLNVRELEDLSTLSEGVQQKLGEPHITEHKTFKPEDPAYATFVKAPFIRPPPSTYLDESVLSMRKRRVTEDAASKKSSHWGVKKKEQRLEEKKDAEAPLVRVRQRCDKCLSSFGSGEELKKHQDLNTCSALFGFDSDDES